MKIAILLIAILVTLILLGWVGFKIKPQPFPAFSQPSAMLKTAPLPDNLPLPVARFYRQVYGDSVPVIESAIISGRATMRINGITMPGRFRFTHLAGQDYRHYIDVTFFGFPIMKVNEQYLDGKSRMELPFGVTEDEPNLNQAANMTMWAEGMWFPTIFITDSRARWEPVDDDTALLVVPYGEAEERFVVRFAPDTGLPHVMEAMRFRDAADTEKTLWLNDLQGWETLGGNTIFTIGAVTWFDQGTPWAVFTVEDMVLNADVEEYIRAKGL